jgi:hypothetical protein
MNRQALIRIFTFLGGIYFFLEYLLPEKIGTFQFNRYNDQITQGLMAVTAMTFGLGLINIFFIHGSKIVFMRKGWFNSAGLLLGLFVMLWVTCQDWRGNSKISALAKEYTVLADFSQVILKDYKDKKIDQPRTVERIKILQNEIRTLSNKNKVLEPQIANLNANDLARAKSISATVSQTTDALNNLVSSFSENDSFDKILADTEKVAPIITAAAQSIKEQHQFNYRYSLDYSLYQLLYEGFFVALGSAMFSLLGFYMAAAAYRAFRVRSYESALMMLAAVIVMLGQIPFGLWIWDGFTDLRLWLLSTPSTAAFRAVKFGAAVAGLVMAFRMWLSIETDSFANNSKGT